MKNLKLAFALLFIILASTSCRYHYGLTHNENHHQTQVVLQEKNYRIIKYVEGDAYARYFLGIGGSNKRGIVARARENMLKEAGLIGSSRAVINETVEMRIKNTFLRTEVRYIVSAYIVEFYDPASESTPQTEENVYVSPDQPKIPNTRRNSLIGGITFQGSNSYGNYQTSHAPGIHVGYRWEYSNPEIKHLIWGTQLNLALLNETETYNGSPHDKERILNIELPFLVGMRLPFGAKRSWYFMGGPTVGVMIIDRKYYPNQTYNNYIRESGSLPSVGAELYTGLQLSNKLELEVGRRFNIDFYDYNYTKVSVRYSL